MALSDPKTVTINAVDHVLARVDVTGPRSIYMESDDEAKLTISHSRGKRKGALIRFDLQKTAVDPLISDRNIIHSMSVSLIVNRPLTGFTVTEQTQAVNGVVAFLQASSSADLVKILGGES